MDRFFIRGFFAFYREEVAKLCSDSGIGSSKVVFAKIKSGAHDSSSVQGYSPAPASGDFGDQAVCVETSEDPADFGAGLFPILTAETQMLDRLKLASDVAIRKTCKAMFSVHDRLE